MSSFSFPSSILSSYSLLLLSPSNLFTPTTVNAHPSQFKRWVISCGSIPGLSQTLALALSQILGLLGHAPFMDTVTGISKIYHVDDGNDKPQNHAEPEKHIPRRRPLCLAAHVAEWTKDVRRKPAGKVQDTEEQCGNWVQPVCREEKYVQWEEYCFYANCEKQRPYLAPAEKAQLIKIHWGGIKRI